eukprot:3375118-Ditylum_brightwellii.AAC.1
MLAKKEEADCYLALLGKKAALKTESFLWQLFHIHTQLTTKTMNNETDNKNKDKLLWLWWYHQPYAHLVLGSKNRPILPSLPVENREKAELQVAGGLGRIVDI